MSIINLLANTGCIINVVHVQYIYFLATVSLILSITNIHPLTYYFPFISTTINQKHTHNFDLCDNQHCIITCKYIISDVLMASWKNKGGIKMMKRTYVIKLLVSQNNLKC